MLAEVVRVERVPVDSNFFDDLGADSMVMAKFCARVRKREDLPSVSMKDVYRHQTIRSLATALAGAPDATGITPVTATSVQVPAPARAEAAKPAGTPQYILCGTLQLLFYLGYVYLGAVVLTRGYDWITGGSSLLDWYLRAVAFGAAAFAGLCILPVAAKWVLVGRWKPREIRIWSLGYVRFWVVKTLIRSNPLVLFMNGRTHVSASSPLYVLYLRALGAKVGRGVAIFSRTVPVCTDLLTIGDGAVVRKDSSIACYRAHAGMIQTGPVALGKDVIVGEATVLDINTSMGDGAQIGHASSLHAGQSVPAGEHWHGSPAERTGVDYRVVGPAACGSLRRSAYAIGQLLTMLLVYLPLLFGGVDVLLDKSPFSAILDTGPAAFTRWTFYRDALAVSVVFFFGAILLGLLFVAIVPRVLNLAIKPDKVYPLYSFRYSLHRAIGRMTNVKFFTQLFGDSSYIVHYLRWIGYDLSTLEQTGSNFGTEVMHETPYHVSVGSGTMVADGLSIINAHFSNTSFTVSRVSIGAHSFLGNRIAYTSQSRTGENCLLATKVLVPVDGPVRQGIGLLGSPSFEIPRSVDRDTTVNLRKNPAEFRRRLSAKNRYNLRSMGLFLLVRWLHFLGITLLAMAAADLYLLIGTEAIAGEIAVSMLFTVGYFCLIERAVAGFRALRPQFCSIYDRYFWWHERYWKLVIPEFDKAFSGTPFKNVISRLLGARIGRRVFDDGCFFPERTLATVGDDCTLNAETVIQCHSQEDGAFKSDRITIGAGSTLGTGAFVHYGVTVGDGAVLGPACFVMKGEEVPPHARWGGNPARDDRVDHDHDHSVVVSNSARQR
ncbi:Pls/PosA family non-ribosomal peptide synthetase [Pseudonocardia acidicola]|nr:Pls/PosA family non-ribosomal peptide synthetase [Pseudonocardia acidicola]